MCLGIPGRVIELVEGYGGQLALVDVAGARRKINIGLLDDGPLAAGSWVLIHMGFALERVDAEGAEQAMTGLELMGAPGNPRANCPRSRAAGNRTALHEEETQSEESKMSATDEPRRTETGGEGNSPGHGARLGQRTAG